MSYEGSYVPLSSIDPQPTAHFDFRGSKPWNLRFFAEYGSTTALWGPGAAPAQQLLSADLAADIADWIEYFNVKFHWEEGWRHGGNSSWFDARGRELCDRARIELGPDYILTFPLAHATKP